MKISGVDVTIKEVSLKDPCLHRCVPICLNCYSVSLSLYININKYIIKYKMEQNTLSRSGRSISQMTHIHTYDSLFISFLLCIFVFLQCILHLSI